MNAAGDESAREIGAALRDKGTMRIVVLACAVIVLAVATTGVVGYVITYDAVLEKIRTRDIVYMIDAASAKIGGRIARAEETSLLLARSPALNAWVAGAEKDEVLGAYALAQMNGIASQYDYANAFIVSAVTNRYWAEGPRLMQVLREGEPDSVWFYNALKARKEVAMKLEFDRNRRRDTFVFVNALVGGAQSPIAVAGVGLSLDDMSREFAQYRFSENSDIWLIDESGKIYLADDLDAGGKSIRDFLPESVAARILETRERAAAEPTIAAYSAPGGETVDLAYRSVGNGELRVVVRIPRSESMAVLDTIRWNTIIASVTALILLVFIFYFVSRRIADPLKRALLLAENMEALVAKRTGELAEKNRELMDGIEYAEKIQASILAKPSELKAIFCDHFVLWRPKALVGGDLYWVRRMDDGTSFIAVFDCTGHGVPGAFMTMTVNALLGQIVDRSDMDPAGILSELNRRAKENLHRNDQVQTAGDGLDIGICRVERGGRLWFAGARLPLYIASGEGATLIKGDKASIGYASSPDDLQFTNHVWDICGEDRFYLATDGFVDQSGGEKNYPFGRKRLLRAIASLRGKDMRAQGEAIEEALNHYMGAEPQRDDITMVGFSLGALGGGADGEK